MLQGYTLSKISALVGTVCGNYGLQAVPSGADYVFLVGLVHVAQTVLIASLSYGNNEYLLFITSLKIRDQIA